MYPLFFLDFAEISTHKRHKNFSRRAFALGIGCLWLDYKFSVHACQENINRKNKPQNASLLFIDGCELFLRNY